MSGASLPQRAAVALIACITASGPATGSEPIRLLPENPRYLEFRGQPLLLVTSGEHYGSVLNLDFDFVPYLDELQSRGLNLTRTFAGTYREVPGSFNIRSNTLAPRPGRFQAPWKRASTEGQPERFDLDAYDPAYFVRLKNFLTEADRRGIVVELVLFCPFYEEVLWEVNPMNGRNNVQALPAIPREEVFALKHDRLTAIQMSFVRRVVEETNGFNNLYYEICNEPYFGGVTLDWQRAVARTIDEVERGLGRRHLIAQNIANDRAEVVDPDPLVSIFNFHYAHPEAALDNLGLERVLGDDETGFDGTGDRPYRTEAWLWILSGGGVFSHLDYSFTPDEEAGTAEVADPTPGGGGATIRSQLALLRRMGEEVDLRRARPVPEAIEGDPKARAAAFGTPGRHYLAYLSDTPMSGEVRLTLPPGTYAARWIDPRDGSELATAEIESRGDPAGVAAPKADEDLVLVLRRRGEAEAGSTTPR